MITTNTLTKVYNSLPIDQLEELPELKAADAKLTKLFHTIEQQATDVNFAELDDARNELDYAARVSGFVLGYTTALKHTESNVIQDDRDVILADIKSKARELSDDNLAALYTVIKELSNQ